MLVPKTAKMPKVLCTVVFTLLISSVYAAPVVNNSTETNDTLVTSFPDSTDDYFLSTGEVFDYYTGATVLFEVFYDSSDSSLPPLYDDYQTVQFFEFDGTTPSSDDDFNNSSSVETVDAVEFQHPHGKPVSMIETKANNNDPWWATKTNSSADNLIDRSMPKPFASNEISVKSENSTAIPKNVTGFQNLVRPQTLPFINTLPLNNFTVFNQAFPSNMSTPSSEVMHVGIVPFVHIISNDSKSLPSIPSNGIHADVKNNINVDLHENNTNELVDPLFSVPIATLTNITGNASAIIPTGLPNQIKTKKLDTNNNALTGKLQNLKTNKTKKPPVNEISSSPEPENSVTNGTSISTDAPFKIKGRITVDESVKTPEIPATNSASSPTEKSVLENAVNPVVQNVISNWRNRNSELLSQIHRN